MNYSVIISRGIFFGVLSTLMTTLSQISFFSETDSALTWFFLFDLGGSIFLILGVVIIILSATNISFIDPDEESND
jgi:hypothetical protein